MTQDLLQEFGALSTKVERLMGQLDAKRAEAGTAQNALTSWRAEGELLTLTAATLDQLLQTVTAESVTAIEQLVTYGLKTVFDNQDLRLRLVLSKKRDMQWVDVVLVSGNVEDDILDAFGGGPAAVVAFLLRVIVITRLKLAPLVLLDEPFPMVSARYAPNVGKLLRELADKLKLTFVVVTHDPESMVPYAHRAYEAVAAADGTVFQPVGG